MESTEVVTDRHILKTSMNMGKSRSTIGLCLGLKQTDIENCRFNGEDAYEVMSLES